MNIPALHGNWVDLVIIAVLIFYIIEGWGRGMVLGVIDMVGFLLSFVVSLAYYNLPADFLIANFSMPKGIAQALGFLIAGFAAEILFSYLIGVCYKKLFPILVAKLNKQKSLYWIVSANRILGTIPAVGEAIIFIAFILTLLVTLPIQGIFKKDIVSSKIGGVLIVRTQGIERKLNSIFGQAVNETLTFLTINSNPSSDEKVDLRFTQKDVTVDELAETTMFNLVNQERLSKGLRHLSLSFELRDLARAYAKDMFARGYFSHYNPEGQSPFDRMEQKGINFLSAGENLAFAPNVHLAHEGFMNSPGHRANILSTDFGKVGVGVMDGGIYGEMFVQEFTN